MLCYAKSLHLCPTLCDPIDSRPPGSAVPGILQARILEWVAISFSNVWKRKVKVKSLSRVWLFSDPMDCNLPGSSVHGFSRQEYWSGVTLPSPKNIHNYSNLDSFFSLRTILDQACNVCIIALNLYSHPSVSVGYWF